MNLHSSLQMSEKEVDNIMSERNSVLRAPCLEAWAPRGLFKMPFPQDSVKGENQTGAVTDMV